MNNTDKNKWNANGKWTMNKSIETSIHTHRRKGYYRSKKPARNDFEKPTANFFDILSVSKEPEQPVDMKVGSDAEIDIHPQDHAFMLEMLLELNINPHLKGDAK